MRRGFESHLSAAFSEEKVVSGLVLCCVALSFFLSKCLNIHVHCTCIHVYNVHVYSGGWEMTSGSGSSREKTMAESGGRGVGRGEGAGGRGVGRGEGAGGRGVERGEGAGGGGEFNEFAQPRPGQDRDRQNDGFSVDSIHHHRSSEDTLRNYEEQLADLRQQLTKVTEEKDSLRQDRERVSAQWEGKVQRLQRKLKQLQGEGEEEVRLYMLHIL